jgi:zinc protease
VCSPENLEDAIEETLNVLYELRDKPVSEEELATAKRQKVSDNAFSRRTAEGVAFELGLNVLDTGNPSFTDMYLEGIESVTADDIMEVARCYLRDSNLTVVTLGPGERAPESMMVSETQVQEPGKVEKVTLENGLRVLVKPTPANPLVHVQWLSLGGTRLEPPGKAGLSRITAHLLTRGADDLDAAGIAQKFDSMGGRFSPVSGNNSFGVEVNVMKENFREAFDLFADMVCQPLFPEDQIELVRKRTLLAISGRRDDWQSELNYLFSKKFFEKSPYRYGPLGEEDTVKAITREDVVSFYENHAIPSRSVLTIFGNVDVAEAIEMARKKFGDMPPVDIEEPHVASELPKGGEMIRVPVAREMSALMMGYPGMRVTDTEDRFAMHVLDAVLSGIGYPGGWLQEALRGGDRDLVYVVHAFNFMGLEPGYFGIMAASTPDKMDRVIEVIEEKVDRMKAGKVSTDELENAKNMCITMEKLQHQTNADMALQRGLNELYGLGYEFPEMFEKRINDVTIRDVQRVAREYLNDPVILRLDGDTGKLSPEDQSS